MHLNLNLNHFDFNTEIDFQNINSGSLIIIICSFNSLKALEILKQLKKIEIEIQSSLVSYEVFNCFLT